MTIVKVGFSGDLSPVACDLWLGSFNAAGLASAGCVLLSGWEPAVYLGFR